MKFILDNFELLVRYAPVALGVSLFLIVLFFAVNSRSVYASLNKHIEFFRLCDICIRKSIFSLHDSTFVPYCISVR